jgi:aminoglycoside phosphotransferase (APT) family kinase protein
MDPGFRKYLLEVSNARDCREVEVIQSLWSGYGKISRYKLSKSKFETVIVKQISLDNSTEHPRGWGTSISHQRKVRSYEIETFWYQNWASKCSNNSIVPEFIGNFEEGTNQWIIMEDLNHKFPFRKTNINHAEIKNCLKWLADLHSTFLMAEPKGLWEIGTYWHLDTRPEEYEKIHLLELKSKARKIDEILNQCKYKTVVHGDAKLANFCFSADGEEVAAVDFQYVGGGCGMKDVAYFLGSCLSGGDCELYEDELLNYYFKNLEAAVALNKTNIDFKELEKEWREMYFFAIADFTRFLLGWMPTHQKLNAYSMRITEEVLAKIE